MVCRTPDGIGHGRSTGLSKLRSASLNVGSLKGKEAEVVETLSRRGIDICCIQEHRLSGGTDANQARAIVDKDSKYKLYWCGCQQGLGGVGILLAEKWIDKVLRVERFTERVMLLRLIIDGVIFSFFSLYAPQAGLPEAEKVRFFDQLQTAFLTVNILAYTIWYLKIQRSDESVLFQHFLNVAIMLKTFC